MKPIDEMISSEILCTIATASSEAQDEFFRLLSKEPALTEEDVLNVMLAVASFKLMMRLETKEFKEAKKKMAAAMYNYFINQVEIG